MRIILLAILCFSCNALAQTAPKPQPPVVGQPTTQPPVVVSKDVPAKQPPPTTSSQPVGVGTVKPKKHVILEDIEEL